MTEAYLILRDFGNRVAEVHLSEVNAREQARTHFLRRHAGPTNKWPP